MTAHSLPSISCLLHVQHKGLPKACITFACRVRTLACRRAQRRRQRLNSAISVACIQTPLQMGTGIRNDIPL